MNRNKQYIYDFEECAPKVKTIDLWLKKYKQKEIAWLETYKKCFYVINKPKHRHRRSMRYNDMVALIGDNDNYRFAREAKPIGRCKRGKWLYVPKRVLLGGNRNDKKPIFIQLFIGFDSCYCRANSRGGGII